ncbi:hypothetical protein V3C99_003216 [Haemonchus contortus]
MPSLERSQAARIVVKWNNRKMVHCQQGPGCSGAPKEVGRLGWSLVELEIGSYPKTVGYSVV